MTQQNAALVEESTAASESLREQAHQLTGAVSQFKLREGTALPPAFNAAAPVASAAPAAMQGPRQPALQIR
ncbi:methyl-accepting protein IV [compost metagenome]